MAEIPAITCPACAKKFKTKADVRGKKIKCPFCAESFVVPTDASSYAVQAEEQAPDAKPAKVELGAWAGEEEGDNPYGVTAADLAPRCPNCAEEMESADAVVCLNCGYNTLTREWGKTEKTIGVSFGRHFVHLLPGIASLFCVILCIIDRIAYCVYVPFQVANTFMSWTDHESLRMWGAMVGLATIFPLGRYAYRRLVVHPVPAEAKVE